MEASSPLAALHRPMLPAPAWGSRDIFRPRPHSLYSSAAGVAGSFSLREQLHRGSADYFSVKDVRGSSPAASLAADLSQNFRIDNEASPHFPTPRRALFTANLMGGMESRRKATPPPPSPANRLVLAGRHADVDAEFVTTPPLPSSSPGPMTELMEMSPLPHKTPFSTLVEVRSPTPILTPTVEDNDEMVLDSPAPITRQGSLEPPKSIVADRKIAAPRRPSLSRMKGLSTTAVVPVRAQTEAPTPAFQFGGDSTLGHLDPEEASSSGLQSVVDMEEAYELVLPHFLPEDPTDTIPRISRETFLDILDGKYTDKFDQRMVVDCRFEYEYEGGHIEGAVNHNDKELLGSQLFQTPMSGKTLLIFHCEYSAHRAPLMARHIRSEDRGINAEFYPRLMYPEVYILDGGYSEFFKEHRNRCFPPEYVEMSDEKHQRTCEREMGRLKARKGLGRAQTFAFGQRVNDSPTAPGRPVSRLAIIPTIGHSPLFNDRSPARRLASY
ncbi:hypothetical protein DCS_05574 [Drechmeria coniospora]|uniref:M-phase inducer phosphatase n=1 Tax=Drechmeria coniospora TaxID=98403 RepID=A0A151GN66_DRECN|nr:hypothetical protein DCS_05574 [Drechmeria coniospora]KYK58557.1 hypothetical protein DCS_05574 [Drechmeria coniospora]